MDIIKEKPLIFDGAMGTYYTSIAKKNLPKCELANIYDKETILNIHKEYIQAGCMAIRTNTFAANKFILQGNLNLLKEVITKGYEIAVQSTKNTGVLIFADIGPISSAEDKDLLNDYKEIVDIFLSLGAVNFIFETFSTDEYLLPVSRYIKQNCPNAYILVEFAISPDGYTRLGKSGKQLIENVLRESSIDACGFNCFSGPYHLLEYVKKLNIKNETISVMPNSGYPTIINNRTFFDTSKEYFADNILEMVKQGVSIVGGCCGTTPEFIQEIVKRMKNLSPKSIVLNKKSNTEPSKAAAEKNIFLEKVRSGKKVIAVELDPPSDTKIAFFIESAKKLKKQEIDAITIADSPLARPRVDSSLLACKLKRELDIITIPHMTCRDRNMNAIKSLLLGLNIDGINNILVVTGDPIPATQRDEVKGVFNFNSALLANYITNLNETVFITPFNICAALNINAKNFNNQLEYAKKKIENGVSMFFTQPIFNDIAIQNLELARSQLPAKILGGIMPIVSYRNASFLNNEISGIAIPEKIIQQYKGLSKEDATELAIEISIKIAEKIKPYIDGYYLITPLKRVDIISDIVAKLKK